ncbi:MAG: ATP-dependent helicase [Clostridium sp.]|nr:ATP-dependent helicase [Clostridium sp.]
MNQNEQLNRGQSDAVAHTDGPCVVIAPPGSGKTKVLTLRIGALIEKHGVPAKHILVVTFTRAAAEQMRERYLQSCGKTDTKVTFGTFHAVFYRILKESLQMGARLDGYRMGQPLRILSEREKQEILTSIVNQRKERRAQFPDREQLCAYISRRKNRMEAESRLEAESGADEAEDRRETECDAGGAKGRLEAGNSRDSAGRGTGAMSAAEKHAAVDAEAIGEEILREYGEACRELGVLDFEDITAGCLKLLQDERNARILAYWRDRYRYFLVDEFQDVSPMQFSILRIIAAPRDNLFVVGDDDQSIYGFRGSDTRLMLALRAYYPHIRTCYLTVNYRSGRRIVDAAKHLIVQNRLRYQKEVAAGGAADGTVRLVVCEEKKTQTRAVCEALRSIPKNETAAVIVRTNAQAAEMERLIGQAGIRIAAARGRKEKNIYEHPVAKDVLAYLMLAAGGAPMQNCMRSTEGAPMQNCMRRTDSAASSPEHLEALLRIVNKPYRAVSRQAVIASGGNLAELLRFYEGNAAMEQILRSFWRQLQCLRGLPPRAAIPYLRRGIGYERTLPEEIVREGGARAEALAVLAALEREAVGMQSQKEWLRAVADGRRIFSPTSEAHCRMQVVTMHACKGLEFDHVVLPYLNEGVVPHKKAFLPEEIEEERRLLYVAMTRARKTLLMTCVHKQGDQKFQISRFLRDLI